MTPQHFYHPPSLSLPLLPASRLPQPNSFHGRNFAAPIAPPIFHSRLRNQSIDDPTLLQTFPQSQVQLIFLVAKIAYSKTEQYPPQRLVRYASLRRYRTPREMCKLGDCVSRCLGSKTMVMKTFGNRYLARKTRWYQSSLEIEADR